MPAELGTDGAGTANAAERQEPRDQGRLDGPAWPHGRREAAPPYPLTGSPNAPRHVSRAPPWISATEYTREATRAMR